MSQYAVVNYLEYLFKAPKAIVDNGLIMYCESSEAFFFFNLWKELLFPLIRTAVCALKTQSCYLYNLRWASLVAQT